MKKQTFASIIGGGYEAPRIESFSMPVEDGFNGSVNGADIDPWKRDEDSLDF